MAFTNQITVNSASDTNIVIQSSDCRMVLVQEDPGVVGWPTTDFLIKKGGSSTYIRVPAGQVYRFLTSLGLFVQTQVIGQIKTVSGTTTFDVDEDQS